MNIRGHNVSLHTGSEQATGHVQWGVVYDEGTGAVPWPARAHPRLLTLPFTRVPVRGIAGGIQTPAFGRFVPSA